MRPLAFPLESIPWDMEARCHPDAIDRLPLSAFVSFLELHIPLVADPWISEGSLFVIDKHKLAQFTMDSTKETQKLLFTTPVFPVPDTDKITFNPFLYPTRTKW